jgi:hypothetical protein
VSLVSNHTVRSDKTSRGPAAVVIALASLAALLLALAPVLPSVFRTPRTTGVAAQARPLLLTGGVSLLAGSAFLLLLERIGGP